MLGVIRERITDVKLREVNVDVIAYNSKVYYVITDGGGYGQQVYRLPITGSETVLDAVGQIGGLPPVSSKKKIRVARATWDIRTPMRCCRSTGSPSASVARRPPTTRLPPATASSSSPTRSIRTDSFLSKLFSPVQRTLGVTLLGAATVNSIKGSSSGFGGLGGLSGIR